MCRHFAHLGPPVALHELLFAAPHALSRQARRPQHQEVGDTNPDGWGVGWYLEDADAPLVHRTVTPIWDDAEFADASRVIESAAILGAARLASPGASISATGNAPFRDGPWLFSLNGLVYGFPDGVGDALRARVTPTRRAAIEGDADSEVLFALALDRLDAGETPGAALMGVIDEVLDVATARLNLLLTDGRQLAATRVGSSLYVRGTTVASEPFDDDPAWREVPERSLVVATSEHDGALCTIDSLR